MDTNVNYQQYNGNIGDFLGKKLSYGDLTSLDSRLGVSAGNQPTFISNGNIYQVYDQGGNTFGLKQIDTVANRQQAAAQQLYQQQQGSAIQTLQTGKADLAGQYGSLLSTVTGEYQPLINQATLQQNAQNASRGLVSNAGNGGTQMISALNPIYSAQAANAQQIGAGSISDTNTYNQAISNAQQSGAQFGAQLPLQYSQLALQQQALPSEIALNYANANAQAPYQAALANALKVAQLGVQYQQVNPGVTFLNTAAKTYFNPSTGQYGNF